MIGKWHVGQYNTSTSVKNRVDAGVDDRTQGFRLLSVRKPYNTLRKGKIYDETAELPTTAVHWGNGDANILKSPTTLMSCLGVLSVENSEKNLMKFRSDGVDSFYPSK